MKISLLATTFVACTSLASPLLFAQEKVSPDMPQTGLDRNNSANQKSPMNMDNRMNKQQQMSQMKQNMKEMQQQMEKFRTTTDPKERQKVMEEHMKSMQNNMQQMEKMMQNN